MEKKSLAAALSYSIPAAETEEGKRRLDEYHLALGRFAHRFALVELASHLVLRHYAKLSQPVARALLSGVRVRAAKSNLQRLHDAGIMSKEDWADAEPLFNQLGIINACRDDILHHGAISVAEGKGMVTNAAVAVNEERITGFEISPEILDAMTEDLRKILLHLHIRHMGRPRLRGAHPQLDAALSAPWRYTGQTKPLAKSRKSASSDLAKGKAPQDPLKPSQG